jgi:hypothetical protein
MNLELLGEIAYRTYRLIFADDHLTLEWNHLSDKTKQKWINAATQAKENTTNETK